MHSILVYRDIYETAFLFTSCHTVSDENELIIKLFKLTYVI